MAVQIKVVFNNLPQVKARSRPAFNRRIHAAGFRVQGDAQGRAPVDTGALRASILNRPGNLSTVVAAGVGYAAYVELGTRKMAAQPYLVPALNAEPPRLIASFGNIEAELAG